MNRKATDTFSTLSQIATRGRTLDTEEVINQAALKDTDKEAIEKAQKVEVEKDISGTLNIVLKNDEGATIQTIKTMIKDGIVQAAANA